MPRQSRRPGRHEADRGHNPAVQAAILEVVENQLRDNNPPEVRQTLERLTSSGFSERQARVYIGFAVLSVMNDILKDSSPFDHDQYVKALLNQLPRLGL